jgi:hypothetical protein
MGAIFTPERKKNSIFIKYTPNMLAVCGEISNQYVSLEMRAITR